MRIDKFLANKAVGSRKEVHGLIKKGLVTVNGEVIKDKDLHIEPLQDTIAVGGEVISGQQVYYIKFHKPAGYVTAVEDNREPTVMELLPSEFTKMGVFPVGRLDKDTEGLLFLTNDGVWAHRVINGRREVPKLYRFSYTGTLVAEAKEILEKGVVLEDGTVCKPATLTLLASGEGELTITEGKYHQVKRMLAAIGGTITYLKRLQIGDVTLKEIDEVGSFTSLHAKEVEIFR